jgi:replicative DNA helicase
MFNKLDGEKVIIFHLLKNSAYFYRVFNKLRKNVFKKQETQIIYEYIKKFYSEFEKQPSIKELALYILNSTLPQISKDKVIKYFKEELKGETEIKNFDFLIDFTEKYLKKVALTDAILESVEIIKKDDSLDGIDIITKFENALDFKFDTDLGMELKSSKEERFKKYKEKYDSIPTGIKVIDDILGGGIRPKTLLLVLSPSHGGKSALLSAISAGLTRQKRNGLYITLEMPEQDILKRVDANLLDTPIYKFEEMTWEEYKAKYDAIENQIGNLFVKEYPAGSFSTFDLEKLKYDIEQENNIKLDYIVIDYLGLMKSTRVKLNQGSYLYFKSISEELHGFAKKHNIPILSAFQLNRGAYNNLEAGMESISESLGVIMTADVSMLLLSNEQLKEQKQVMLKTEKNRYTGKLDKVLLEVDWPKMKFKGVDEADDVIEDLNKTFGMDSLTNQAIDNIEISPIENTKIEDDDFDFDI